MNVAIIPARGGSQRIPFKNIQQFYGKPIIAYSIEVAQKSGLFDKIIVSTDDREIAEIAAQFGASVFIRSEEMGHNDVGTQEVARDVLMGMQGVQKACVIYPCSPLLMPQDLCYADAILDDTADYAMSIGTEPLQDAGNFYYGWAKSFKEDRPLFDSYTKLVPLPKERACDVNTPEDLQRCEEMYGALNESG